MKKTNQIKKGTFLWWKRTGNSSNQDINCPCVVTKVTKKGFKVKTFDDFKESELIPFDSTAHKEELRKTSKSNVEAFLDMKHKNIQDRIEKVTKEKADAFGILRRFKYDKKQSGF